MPRFIVLSRLTAQGNRSMKDHPAELPDIEAEVANLGGKVVDRYAMLGPHDFLTVVEVRDNDTAQLLRVADRGGETASRQLLPAIDLNLFIRLLGQSTTNTGPYKWQISPPARAFRRLFRGHAYLNNVEKYCKPFTVLGQHHFEGLRGPALFVANHASFMDGSAVYAALPNRYRSRVAWPAAADRFFIKGRRQLNKQGWWFSLMYNSFPLVRGGGSSALSYTDWLIEKGWSIVIFPEGARTSSGKLARFRMGPALLAARHGLPVVPMYLEGLGAIRPKGSREMKAGPVTVRVGEVLRFTAGSDPKEAHRAIYHAVDHLRLEAAEVRRAARAETHPQELGTAAG
jgi:1-acyl-sn-glycerol-3-phosphate acyltransferase/uncharacterized protein with GYD domain